MTTVVPTYSSSGPFAVTTGISTSFNTTYPAGVAKDDVALLLVKLLVGETLTAFPSGFTQISTAFSGGTYVGVVYLAWKRCDGTESSTTVTSTVTNVNGANSTVRGILHVFRGCVTSGTPYESWSSQATTSNTTQTYTRWPSAVTTVASTLGVHIGFRIRPANLTPTVTAEASWTKRYDAYSQTTATPPATCEMLLETKILASSGTVASVDSTSADSLGYYAGTLALLPSDVSIGGLFFGSTF